jgi:hypothetical protein
MAVEPMAPYLEPIRKAVDVPLAPEDAFALFAERIAEWWPLGTAYSVFGTEAVACGIQPFVGGEIFEIGAHGRRAVWGVVRQWQPGKLLEFSWFPGRTAETAQTVRVAFTATDAGTRIDLEHRDWQTLGDRAKDVREGYGPGWDEVLGHMVGFAVSHAGSRPADA